MGVFSGVGGEIAHGKLFALSLPACASLYWTQFLLIPPSIPTNDPTARRDYASAHYGTKDINFFMELADHFSWKFFILFLLKNDILRILRNAHEWRMLPAYCVGGSG